MPISQSCGSVADDNIVYCLRDCCFAHMSPVAIPFDVENEDAIITRKIVRSYVTPEGKSLL